MTSEKLTHVLIPEHELLDEAGTTEVLMKYGIDRSKLPKILKSDPSVPEGAKIGDVVKITRKSATAGISLYYRVVIE